MQTPSILTAIPLAIRSPVASPGASVITVSPAPSPAPVRAPKAAAPRKRKSTTYSDSDDDDFVTPGTSFVNRFTDKLSHPDHTIFSFANNNYDAVAKAAANIQSKGVGRRSASDYKEIAQLEAAAVMSYRRAARTAVNTIREERVCSIIRHQYIKHSVRYITDVLLLAAEPL